MRNVRLSLTPKRSYSGRLLSEFLVGLGLLFLSLIANMAILHSATESSAKAALNGRALEIARNGIEEVIHNPKRFAKGVTETRFGAGNVVNFEATFLRKIWLTSLSGQDRDLLRVTVVVDWDEGGDTVRMERYVRGL